jgi:hypothetical protein
MARQGHSEKSNQPRPRSRFLSWSLHTSCSDHAVGSPSRSCPSTALLGGAQLLLSQDEHLVLGRRFLLDDQGAADGHDQGDDAVDALGGLVLGGLEVASGVLGDRDIGGPFGPAALRDLHQNAALTP